ncbi:hypothetical protein GGI25_005269 [Coemansia spiralis]|uniref:Uncharacterized protein n=2 Tax=Coemansia TaxID=4863 RepID=A0A9W8FYW2_9FUNG|nr:hypothetical protein EDC05_005278 [Coemansia umbellata]KAJ2672029.1 hypothetical protein GGI25_005269 [Coemansia spiralis]
MYRGAQFCSSGEGWGPWSVQRELDLTPCFERGILLPLLNCLFLVPAIHQIRHLQTLHSLPAAYCNNFAYWIKLVLASAIATVAAVELFYFIYSTGIPNSFNVFIVGQLFHIAMLVVAALLHHYEHIKSCRPSDTLLLYWLFAGFVSLVVLRTDYLMENEPKPVYSVLWIVRYIYVIGIAALFYVELWPCRIAEYVLSEDTDDLGAFGNSDYAEEPAGKRAPEESANIFSRLSFAWLSPLLELGQHKQIDEGDLWKLPAKYAPLNVAEKFDTNWQHELNSSMHRTPSLLRALWKTHGANFALSGVFKLIQDILQFTQPVLLSHLIGFVASHATDNPQPVSYGLFYAVAMFVCQFVLTIFLHQYSQLAAITGMNVKASLISTIYKKVLRLSNDTRQEYTTGNITTLFSVDVQNISDTPESGHMVWSGPMQIMFAIYLLYNTLGWSVFAGVFIMVAATPINSWIGKRIRALYAQQMKNKDKRTSLIEDSLSGIKVIKLYAWERPFLQRIQHVRESLELAMLSKFGAVYALGGVSVVAIPFMVSFTTFFIYSVFDGVSHGPLTAQLVFVPMSLFNLMRGPLTLLPWVITTVIEANIAIGRVYKLLTSDELDHGYITQLESIRKSKQSSSAAVKNSANADGQDTGAIAVEVKDGSFRWSSNGSVILDSINVIVRSSEHLAVVGRVGSGKSSLASALLGDMQCERGEIVIHGQVAYTPQQPWIMNTTLRDNILFGLKYDEAFYNQVIDACALRPDLDIFAAGDMTEIGERGINLSGGQKARVSLARAVYARADVYILDDPLSAVDAHVGRHLFEHVLGPNGLLKSRCRIHITNAIQFITMCDSVMLLRDGTSLEYGAVADLIESRSHVYSLVQEFGTSNATSTPASSTLTPSASNARLIDIQDSSRPDTPADGSTNGQMNIKHRSSVDSLPPASIAPIQRTGQICAISNTRAPGTLITEEISAVGRVSLSAYISYICECSWGGVIVFAIGLLFTQGLLVLSNVWLKVWSSANETNNKDKTDPVAHSPMFYISIYGMFGLFSAVACYIRYSVLWRVCAVRSGKSTHRKMLNAVFRSPMSYFDTTPIGRILQRFSKDQHSVDQTIPHLAGSWAHNLINFTLSLMVISASLPAFCIVIIPIAIAFYHLKKYYLETSRTLKRLDSTTGSPIFASFQETLVGVATIRAFGQSERFMAENLRKIDANQRCQYPYKILSRWLAVRLEWVSSVIVFSTALLGVLSLIYGKADAGLIGLAVTYALQSSQHLSYMLRMECDLENSMCDYVRIQEIEQLSPEAPEVIEDNRPKKEWPEHGMIEFKNYSTRYREGLDLVLKELSFRVMPNQKVGIVGRTGAGKSSLTLALFRIIEAAGGRVLIDGEDISQYGLFDVRSKLSIIPQDPVLFAGTVRENLDPFEEYADQDIWRALEHAHLAEFIHTKDEGLEFVVTQGGENFSVGQRQLICLARALLKRAKILVLDEATAAIDNSTDAIIQESIRKEFKDCTVLTIAHRLNTIIDSDMILVLDNGKAAEFDTPQSLLAKEDGLFKQLWTKANKN